MRRRLPAALREAQAQQKRVRLERRAALIGAGVEVARRGKYHNTKTTYNGQVYDSLGEAERAAKLDMMLKAGEIVAWERPKPVVLVNGPKARDRITMRPDFYVIPAGDAYSWYEDYKGSTVTETAAFKLKVKLWRQNVPFELRVVYPSGEHKVVATGAECGRLA